MYSFYFSSESDLRERSRMTWRWSTRTDLLKLKMKSISFILRRKFTLNSNFFNQRGFLMIF